MLKRIISTVLVIVIALSFTSCTTLIDNVFQEFNIVETEYIPQNNNEDNALQIDKSQIDEDIELSPYYNKVTLKNGYEALKTDSQRKCYVEILNSCENFAPDKNTDGYYSSGRFRINNCSISEYELAQVFSAIFLDNPQLFWVEDIYSYSIFDNYLYLELYYSMSKEKCIKFKKQINAVINDVLSGLDNGMSKFDLELYLHDYLVKNCVYDNASAKKLKGNAFNCYGALVQQKAVCQGYVDAFQLLLSYVGINSFKVSGTAEKESHIWNVVELDNSYYYVDVTWDDSKDYMMYDYFNVTTKQLCDDHEFYPFYDETTETEYESDKVYNMFSVKCNNNKYNYYVYKGFELTEYPDDKITDMLIEAVNNNEDIIHFYVNPDYLDFDVIYNKMFSQENYGFLDYINEANHSLGYNIIDTKVYVSKKKKLNTITVELKYIRS